MIVFKKNIVRVTFAVIGAVLITLMLGFDMFTVLANRVYDSVFQSGGVPNSQIVIVTMDEKSIDTYGQMPWSREIMAKAIENLTADADKSPAVIGIDTLYTNSENSEADKAFVEAVEKAGNVVVGANISFGSELVEDNGNYFMDNSAVLLVEEPFEELKAVSKSGHLNAMLDTDAILRHAIWEIDLQNGESYPSFNQVIYQEYMAYMGEEAILQPPTDENHMWYVPFSSRPEAYDDGFSIVDLVEGNLDPDYFAGKIVLIGPYALGMSDEYFTAVDHTEKMFGVEYQANAISALITGNLKTEVSTELHSIILFAITALSLNFFFKKRWLFCTIAWLVISLGFIAVVVYLWNIGYVMPIFYLPTAVTICYIMSVLVNYFRSVLEKNEVTKSFKRYVSPELALELIKNESIKPNLGGKMADIAVMFVDIRGFTALSEMLKTEDLAQILNDYLSLISNTVLKNSGTLDKFLGDGAMAFWGAPIFQEDIKAKAVKSAMEITEKSKPLNEKVKKLCGKDIGIGIGLNFGPAMVGNFGSHTRMDYTAIGDTVNVASRLEAISKMDEILVAESMIDAIPKGVEFVSLGENIHLKGKSEKVEIYRISL